MKYFDCLKESLISVRGGYRSYSPPGAKIRIHAPDFEYKQLTSACDVSSLQTEYVCGFSRCEILRQTRAVSGQAHVALANWSV
jgi:hypothetical protein